MAVRGVQDAVSVAAGVRHTCAIREDGSVVCFGANGDGRLGDGTTTDRETAVPVPGLSGLLSRPGAVDVNRVVPHAPAGDAVRR